jgi:hypothetical protein
MEKTNVSGLPILEDFDLFLTFLRSNKEIPLTSEKAQLRRTDLYRLNGELHFKADRVTDKSMQSAYPALNFFYHVVLAARMARIHYGEKGNHLRPEPDQLERYSLLSRTEQYFFLLQTTWCYLNWAKLSDSRGWYVTEPVLQILQLVGGHPPGRTFEIQLPHSAVRHEHGVIHLDSVNLLVQPFWFLGFFEVQPAVSTKKPDRFTFPFDKLTVAETGTVLGPVLLTQRPLELWNAPMRRELGEWGVPLGLTEEQYFPEDEEGHLAPPSAETPVIPAFLSAFAPLFEPGELAESFYSDTPAFTPGLYVLKVALDKKLYRTIAIGATATLDDLHLAIQDAFRFDNDHLYAFYMDGEPWSGDRFNAPELEEGPFTDDVQLGELDLYTGRRFLYLFDFGDSWEFWITVLEINPSAPEPKSPKVVDKLGKNPKQYRDW